jgi:hypothetical protein
MNKQQTDVESAAGDMLGTLLMEQNKDLSKLNASRKIHYFYEILY